MTTNIIDFPTAQACLPLLEAEAKARQILSGGDKKSELAKSVVPTVAPPIGSPENPTMSPVKNNLRASQEIANEAPNSPALILAKDAISNLTDDEVDELFSYLWAMGYGETSSIFTD
jgi:hypothetical protein